MGLKKTYITLNYKIHCILITSYIRMGLKKDIIISMFFNFMRLLLFREMLIPQKRKANYRCVHL